MKKAIIAGLFAVVAVGVLAVAVAAAQTNSPTVTPDPSTSPTDGTSDANGQYKDFYLNDLANRLGVSVDTLKSDMQTSEKALVAKALADGKITQEQANDLNARIDAGQHVNFRFVLGGHKGVRHAISDIIGAAASVLGIQKSDVQDGLKAGTSLNDIAAAHGMSADAFKTALLAQAKTDLDAHVASGDITQDQADTAYQKLTNNIDTIVTDTRGTPGGPFGPGRFRGRWGNDNGSPEATPAPSGTTTLF
jgi:lambda repressor-like predicted transcriptional regulator